MAHAKLNVWSKNYKARAVVHEKGLIYYSYMTESKALIVIEKETG